MPPISATLVNRCPDPAAAARIDRELGNGDGYLDSQEEALSRASYAVYQSTGMNIRPQLAYTSEYGGIATYDAYDRAPRVFVSRDTPERYIPFVTFHEAGHVAHGDNYTGSSVAKELRADHYAGQLIAATGEDIYAGLECVRASLDDGGHGTSEQRAQALWDGYVSNGGQA